MTDVKFHSFHNTIIREYDIRGVYNETLFDKDAEILGNLFGQEVGVNKTVNVGFDGRLSSINLKKKLVKGLVDSGVNVNEIGLVPTPLLYYSCFELIADGGIIVTGSHNPKDHNGFKIVLNNKPFFGTELVELSKKAEKFNFNKMNGLVKDVNLIDEYVKRLIKNFNQKKKNKCHMGFWERSSRICNGMSRKKNQWKA